MLVVHTSRGEIYGISAALCCPLPRQLRHQLSEIGLCSLTQGHYENTSWHILVCFCHRDFAGVCAYRTAPAEGLPDDCRREASSSAESVCVYVPALAARGAGTWLMLFGRERGNFSNSFQLQLSLCFLCVFAHSLREVGANISSLDSEH